MYNKNKPASQASFISVKSVKRNQGKAIIELSSGDTVVMPRSMLRERPYRAGAPFDSHEHDTFIGARSYAFALDKAVALLSIRARTEREITDSLRKCAYPEHVIARVMARLQEAGYLSDSDFAQNWTASRIGKGFGSMRIQMELRHKGVEQNDIDEALSSMDDDALLEGALKAARKAARGKDLSDHAERQKVLAALARRGFDFATAKRALQSVLENDF